MSKLQNLIDELCPNGVEFKKLGEVAYYPKKRIPCDSLTVNSYVGVENLLKDKKGKTNANNVPLGQAIEFLQNDILIGNIRPYLKKIWLADIDGGTNGDVICIRLNEEYKAIFSPRFLYFILSSDSFFNYDNNNTKEGKMPRGNKEAILKFEIPVPPLPVQEEIVRILDKFTTLEAELEAELDCRKRQYEYYRDKLLTFSKLTGGV